MELVDFPELCWALPGLRCRSRSVGVGTILATMPIWFEGNTDFYEVAVIVGYGMHAQNTS